MNQEPEQEPVLRNEAHLWAAKFLSRDIEDAPAMYILTTSVDAVEAIEKVLRHYPAPYRKIREFSLEYLGTVV